MAEAMLRTRVPSLVVESAGTHSIPGLPMSARTRKALASFEVAHAAHLSKQVDEGMLKQAALIAIFEPMHVNYLRRNHSSCLGRVASLPRLARHLPHGPSADLAERVGRLELAGQALEPWEEVVDPAGGDLDVFVESATQIDGLVAELASRLVEADR